jgi:hypothetical protein
MVRQLDAANVESDHGVGNLIRVVDEDEPGFRIDEALISQAQAARSRGSRDASPRSSLRLDQRDELRDRTFSEAAFRRREEVPRFDPLERPAQADHRPRRRMASPLRATVRPQ